MELFGVAHKKAHKLIELLKTHELFIYNEKNDCLFAKSFKSKDEKHYGNRRKYTAIADYCRKLQVHDGMTLRELVRELRNTLLMNVIHANEQDGFIVSGNKQTATKPNVQRAIPQRKLAKSIGMSKSSASRYINRMAKENSISFSGVVFGYAKSVFGGQFVWTVCGRVYSISSRHLSESFKNVIYNYHYPYTLQAQTSAELDGKWKY